MRAFKILLAIGALTLASTAAAEEYQVVGTCGTPNGSFRVGQVANATMNTNGQPCVTSAGGGSGAVTIADGADVTQGAKADAKSTATDTTPVTVMQVLKEISAMEQAPASRAVTNAGTFAAQATLQTQTDTVMTGGVNVKEINAVTPLMGNGTTGTGSQRVTIASDNTPFHTIIDTGSTTVVTGTVTASATLQTQTDTTMVGGVNVKEINAVTPLMGNGTTGTGSQRVTIASDNTAFTVNAVATNAGTFAVQSQPTPVTSGGLSIFSEIVPNNTTSVVVKASAGQIYDLEVGSSSSTPLSAPLFVKFYDAAQGSTTCGSGTPKDRFIVTGGSNVSIPLGAAYATAITVCVTGGIADNDTTSPTASTYYLSVHYK